MAMDTGDNDLATQNKEVDTAKTPKHPLTVLQEALAGMPALDQQKVQAVLAKLKEGSIEILGSPEEREESAKRIAQKILSADTET